MLPQKYYINVNKDTLPLITFLNDGIEPTNITEKDPKFLFEINAPRAITVGRDAIKAEDDLYDEDGTMKDEYYDYNCLIG